MNVPCGSGCFPALPPRRGLNDKPRKVSSIQIGPPLLDVIPRHGRRESVNGDASTCKVESSCTRHKRVSALNEIHFLAVGWHRRWKYFEFAWCHVVGG